MVSSCKSDATFSSIFEHLCRIIGECIQCNEHGDSGCDVTYTLDIENNLSFQSLFSSIYASTELCACISWCGCVCFVVVWDGVSVVVEWKQAVCSCSVACTSAANSHPHSSSSVWSELQAVISYHPSHC